LNVSLLSRALRDPALYASRALDPRWWRERAHDARVARSVADEVLRFLPTFSDPHRDLLETRRSHLRRILSYALAHSPFHSESMRKARLDIATLDGFDRLPLLDKHLIRGSRQELTSDDISHLRWIIGNTGGSTGEPLAFPISSVVGEVDRVHQLAVFREGGHARGDVIVAVDGSVIPPRSLARGEYWVRTSTDDIPYGRLSYSALHLDPGTVDRYVDHLARTAPAFIRGYPAAIETLARRVLERGMESRFRVKMVELTAEESRDRQVEMIAAAFGPLVMQQYGQSEGCLFAHGRHGADLLCSPFYGYVEVVGDDGRHVAPGEVGEVVATAFHNRALPFIRYRTGDLAEFGGDEKGVVRLRRLAGRTQDVLLGRNGEPVFITAVVFAQHLAAFGRIRRWQLEQRSPGTVIARIQPAPGFGEGDALELERMLVEYGGLEATIEMVDDFPLTPAGKFRFVIGGGDHPGAAE
jgi:phenylacetate-CoA ligase